VDLRYRDHWEFLGVFGRIILKRNLQAKYSGIGLIWLRIENDGCLFSTRNFGVPYNAKNF
jgi:hypothetical protein